MRNGVQQHPLCGPGNLCSPGAPGLHRIPGLWVYLWGDQALESHHASAGNGGVSGAHGRAFTTAEISRVCCHLHSLDPEPLQPSRKDEKKDDFILLLFLIEASKGWCVQATVYPKE